MSSKRRNLSALVFLLNLITKVNLIRILKRENKLHLFRRFEDCITKQINCAGAIEFLQLCKSFDLTPTFGQGRLDEVKQMV